MKVKISAKAFTRKTDELFSAQFRIVYGDNDVSYRFTEADARTLAMQKARETKKPVMIQRWLDHIKILQNSTKTTKPKK